MAQKLPILPLQKHERVLLEEIYRRNFDGKIFNFVDAWMAVQTRLPKHFRLEQMDRRLISEGGEKMRIMGVMALQKNRSAIAKTDRMMRVIWKLIQENPKAPTIKVSEIAAQAGLTEEEVSFFFHMITDISQYHTGSNNLQDSRRYTEIAFQENLGIYQKFKEYPGIEAIVNAQFMEAPVQTSYFTEGEIVVVFDRLDQLKEAITRYVDERSAALEARYKNALLELRDEIDELKPLTRVVSKKQWAETTAGKFVMKGFEKAVWDQLLPWLIEVGKPIAKGFFHYLKSLPL